MKIADGIMTVPGLLTPDECQQYVEFTEAIGYEAATITTASGFALRPEIRNNSRVIVDDPDRAAFLWERSWEHIPVFIRGRQAIGLNERFRFYRYDPGERFTPHRDGAFRRDNG
jgi:prolyl 4-hydroxylase